MKCSNKIFKIQRRFSHSWIKPNGHDTGIRVYNCLAKEKVPFIVQNKNATTWYTCGPTVYDSAHIGHASCYVKLDIVQRILKKYFKLNLVTVMNITDVDDKIINKSNLSGKSCNDIAQHYERKFWEDMDSLGVQRPHIVLRVMENMEIIQDFVRELLKNNAAYKDTDGSVLFDIKSQATYGKLQNICSSDGDTNISNFTVWKSAKPNEPVWNADYGPGRPGWHTECAALASNLLGSTIDVHAGGIDLQFPHHENEEIQCCAYFSQPQWVNYWFHTGHLLEQSIKMSKSLNNTISIKTLLQKCDADTFRIMCLMSHYRSNMELSDEYVKNASGLLSSYRNFLADCNACFMGKMKPTLNQDVLNKSIDECITNIHNHLVDDFDTASSLKSLKSLISNTNKMLHSSATTFSRSGFTSLMAIYNFVNTIFDLFGITGLQNRDYNNSDFIEMTNILTDFRQSVRSLGIEKKDQMLLQLCDSVREKLKKCDVVVKDHGKLSSWIKQ